MFRYTERPPTPTIAPWVLSLWSFQSDATLPADEPYTVWPDGCTSIAFLRIPHVPTTVVCVGPRKTALRPTVTAGQRLWGVRLWPDALSAVTGTDAPTLRDYLGLAPPAISAQFAAMAAELPVSDETDVVFPALNGLLEPLLMQAPQPDAQVRRAVQLIVAARGEVQMADIAREASIGLRQLQRRFPAATGLTLREYARVRRLREALSRRIQARPPGWSRIAAETGFVDHAHLTREFRSLTGLLPTHVAEQIARTSHTDVSP